MMDKNVMENMLGSTKMNVVPDGGYSFDTDLLLEPIPYSEEGSMWLFCKKCGKTFPLMPKAVRDMCSKAGVSPERGVRHDRGLYFEVSDCELEDPKVSLVEA